MKRKPFEELWKNRVEVFNELVVLGVTILSTSFANEPNENMGWFIIVVIIVQALANFIFNIVVNARKWYEWVRRKCKSHKNSTKSYSEVQKTERKLG